MNPTRPLLKLALSLLAATPPVFAQQPDTLRDSIPPPPDSQSGARLGWSVAVDGGLTAVGAPHDDIGGVQDSGVVKVFDSATGALLHLLANPTPTMHDWFGWSVAIEGTRVVVGAPSGSGAVDAASAYVYDLASASPTIPVVTLLKPGSGSLGYSVAISGTRVVVGTGNVGSSASGWVYVYDLASATPTVPVVTFISPSPDYDRFGSSVAISGTRVAVGAPWDDTGADAGGKAYVYDLSSASPTVPLATLNNPSPVLNGWFGSSVAISGTRVVVGAGTAESAYVYDLASASPTVPVATFNSPGPAEDADAFGSSVAIFGTHVVVGAPFDDTRATYAGRAYVYDLANASPTVPIATLDKPNRAPNDLFGSSVAISGTRVVVGAYQDDTGGSNAGSAYVYNLSSGTPTVPVATLNNPGPAAGDYFGYSVAISGTRVVVGAYGDDTGASSAGSAYVYDLTSGTPTVPVATLNNPGPSAFDSFGYSVAISGTRVVVGAYGDNAGASNTGSAYVYDLSSATPTVPVATLNNPSPAGNDLFGNSVAIDSAAIAIGTPGDDSVLTDKGFAYVFAPADPDFDGDGLLDIWEYARFGSINAHTALDDTDRDGRNELLELAFDGDPTVPDLWAAPAITSEGSFLTMTIQKRAGVSYLVETAGSPDNAAFSTATTTTMINTATLLKVHDNFTPATAAERLIRVKVNAAP